MRHANRQCLVFRLNELCAYTPLGECGSLARCNANSGTQNADAEGQMLKVDAT
jgi:hypothetical protein